MQLTSVVAVVLAISSVALAQAPPACALACLQKTGTFGCQMTDNACLCKNTQFTNAQSQCYNATCNGDALKAALGFAADTCSAVGVTLSNLPPSATGGAPASSAAPAATSPASAPAASASSTSKPKSAASSLTVPVGLLAIVAACSLAL